MSADAPDGRSPRSEHHAGQRMPRLGAALLAAASVGVAAVFALPLYFMLAASLRQPGLPPPRTIEWLPDPLVWLNYVTLFDMLPFGRYVLNSLSVAGLAVPLTLLTASWAGFAMAQLGAPARRRLVLLCVVLLMTPITAVWLTRLQVFNWLGWVNSYAALLAPAFMGTSPLFVLLFYWAFRRVPAELFESARLDGASALTIWRAIAMPLALPTAAAVGILCFMLYWSDFISPLLYLKSESLYTLPVGVRQLQQLERSNWPLLMAAAVVMTAPAVALFAVAQRFFLGENSLLGPSE